MCAHLFMFAFGTVELLMTLSLSPSTQLFLWRGTPRHWRVECRSTIFLMQVLAVTNSDPHIAASMVACFLEHPLIGAWFKKCKTPTADPPFVTSWHRLASRQCDDIMHLPNDLGASSGAGSSPSPCAEHNQSKLKPSKSEWSGSLVQILMTASLHLTKWLCACCACFMCPFWGVSWKFDKVTIAVVTSKCPIAITHWNNPTIDWCFWESSSLRNSESSNSWWSPCSSGNDAFWGGLSLSIWTHAPIIFLTHLFGVKHNAPSLSLKKSTPRWHLIGPVPLSLNFHVSSSIATIINGVLDAVAKLSM